MSLEIQATSSEIEPVLITERQIRRTMRLSILEGVPGIGFIAGTSGSVITGFALSLGATSFEIGLISSIGLLGQLLTPLVAWWAGLLGRRKPLCVVLAFLGRLVWFPAIILPAILPAELRPVLLLTIITLSGLFNSSAGVLWVSWMGDVIPTGERGRFLGLRSGLLGIIAMVANLGAGALIDRIASPLGFQIVLGVATVLGAISALILIAHTEPRTPQPRNNLWTTLTEPFGDANFRRVLLFAVYWTFSVLIAAPFVIPYFLQYLKMSYTQIAILSVIGALCALVFAPMWGRIADRVGNKPMLQFTTMIAATLLPLSWMLASPVVLLPIWIGAVVDAFANTATGQGSFNLLLSSTAPIKRTGFVSAFFATTGLAGFLGGLGSGPLLELFSHPNFAISTLGLHWTGYHWLFLLSAIMRVQAWWLLKPIHEDGAWTIHEMIMRKQKIT